MIYTDFGSILAPKENNIQMNIRKQYTDKSYTSKYQKDVACSYDCNLICLLIWCCLLIVWSKKVSIVLIL